MDNGDAVVFLDRHGEARRGRVCCVYPDRGEVDVLDSRGRHWRVRELVGGWRA